MIRISPTQSHKFGKNVRPIDGGEIVWTVIAPAKRVRSLTPSGHLALAGCLWADMLFSVRVIARHPPVIVQSRRWVGADQR